MRTFQVAVASNIIGLSLGLIGCQGRTAIDSPQAPNRAAKVAPRTKDGSTPMLIRAASVGDGPAILRALQSEDVNITDRLGYTALHLASRNHQLTAVRILLEHGADPNIRDKPTGCTPLFLAALTGDLPIVKLLIARGADPKLKSSYGSTAADFAKDRNFPAIAKFIDSAVERSR